MTVSTTEQTSDQSVESTSSEASQQASVLSVTYTDNTELYNSYMQFISGGALFVATSENYSLGDEVFLLISLIDETKKFKVAGNVIWITPPCAQGGHPAGIGVQFTSDTNHELRSKVETYLAGALESGRPTDTM